MYKKILVPLDGSELAASALPHAEEIARKFGSEVILMSVAPEVKTVLDVKGEASDLLNPLPPYWAQGMAARTTGEPNVPRSDDDLTLYIDQQEDRIRAEVRSYLLQAAHSLTENGVKITPVVQFGKAADGLIDYAKNNGVDLIVMSTHGRGGIGRWFAGSVAERVLRGASVPILLVRCAECADVPKQMTV